MNLADRVAAQRNGNAKATKTSDKPYIGYACPQCKTGARTMHTYRTSAGTMRRRECPHGHRFTTMERLYMNSRTNAK